MSVIVAITRDAVNTATGNQDFTTNDLDGLTPKAAFFIITSAISDGTPRDNAIISFGAATDTTERWSVGVQAQHDVGTTNTGRRAVSDECIMKLFGTSTNVDGEADFVSFIANGVRINWGNAPALGYLLTVVLFAGTDLTAKAGTFTVGNEDVPTDVNTVGFEPDVLLTASVALGFTDAGSTFALLSHGVVTNDVSVGQYCWAWNSRDGRYPLPERGRGRENLAILMLMDFPVLQGMGMEVVAALGI
jgi:hypothetical protein